jgi:O-antigen/teichoic acid export membrane protein
MANLSSGSEFLSLDFLYFVLRTLYSILRDYMSLTSFLYKGKYAVLDRIVFSLFTLTYVFLSARLIPKEQYGLLMISLSIAAFLNLASEAGVGSALVKYGSEEGADFGRVFSSAVTLKLIFVIVLSLLIVVLSGFLSNLLKNEGLIIVLRSLPLLVLATSLNNIIKQAMQAKQAVKKIFLVDLTALIVLALLYSLFSVAGRLDSALTVIILVSSSTFAAAVFGAVTWLTRQKVAMKVSGKMMLQLVNFGKYSSASELSTVVYSRIDTVMIGYFLTAVAAARYNAAWILSYGVNLFLGAISLLAFPASSRAHSVGDKQTLKTIYEKTTGVALSFTVPLSIILVVFADQIIGFLYSNRFPEAAVVLRILAFWWLVKPFGNMAGNVFYGMGKPKVLAMLTSACAVLNVLGNLTLIPRYGIVGAAWASVISFSISTFAAYLLMRRWLKVSIKGIAVGLASVFARRREAERVSE